MNLNKMDNELEPIVSVCVMTFQHVSFIRECLDSILIQKTSFPFEIILGEDESTDGTREICKEYAEKNPNKIKLFLRSRKDVICVNGSPTGRYNFIECLKAAKGKYIALCEGDDYWTDENKLQKQVDFLEANENYAICFHRVNVLRGNKPKLVALNSPKVEETSSIEKLAEGNFIYTPSVVFRNHLFKCFPEWFNLSPVGDYVLFMLVSKYGLIKYFPEAMAVYRKHSGGMWTGLTEHKRLERWLKLLDYMIQDDLFERVKEQLILQKRMYREKYLWLLMNEKDWALFLEKLDIFSSDDEYISRKWLLEYYPKYISSYTSSRSIQATKSVALAIKQILKR